MPLTFKRDRFFWTLAIQTGIVNFFLGGFGPSQPLLRADQGTSLAVAGLHGTVMGIASIFAGFVSPHLAHRFGRDRMSWIGLGIFSLGLVGFVFSPPVQLTLIAIFITGFGISTVINAIVGMVSLHFGKAATVVIAKTNAIGSAGFMLGTLLVGSVAGSFRSHWRLALLLALPVAIGIFLFGREKNSNEHMPPASGHQKGKLSPAFWISWVGFICCISSEFATTFWSAALLRDRTQSNAAVATLALVAIGTGMAFGRWYGGSLLKRLIPDHQLLAVIGLQFIAFSIFWFSHNFLISLVALLFVGLGLSTQFALLAIRLIGLSDGRPELAIGRTSIAAGIAIGLSPFILGLLGDHVGISRAYIMVPVLIAFAFIVIAVIPSHAPQETLSSGENEL